MAKVSIIVPVYNCEVFLEKCVNSILAQTEPDFQLILVDDGSTDASGRICDAFAEKDNRIMVIHQKNAGVSAARNAGLDAAAGEYIGFVDADDYIAEDTYEEALAASGDCDMVMWDAVTVWDDGRTEEDTIPLLSQNCTIGRSDWSPELLRYMAGSVWRCLYSAKQIGNVWFPVGIQLSEDRLFNLQIMGKAERLNYLKRGLYFRYVRAGSACNSYHSDLFEKNLRAGALAKRILEQYWDERYDPTYVRMFIINGALSAIYQICSKASPYAGIKAKLHAIRSITDSDALETAFGVCDPQGTRQKLLQRKANLLLLAAGIAFEIKMGEER